MKKLFENANETVGKHTLFSVKISLCFTVCAVIFAVICYIGKDFGSRYYDFYEFAFGLLTSARSCLFAGLLGSTAVYIAEHK